MRSLNEDKIYKMIRNGVLHAFRKKGCIVKYIKGNIKNGKVSYMVHQYLDPIYPGDITDENILPTYCECELKDFDKIIEDGESTSLNDELRKKDKELAETKKVLEGFRADMISANEDLLERNRQIFMLSRKNSEKTEEISNLKAKIVEKENYITKLMTDIENRDATIKLLEEKLAGGNND